MAVAEGAAQTTKCAVAGEQRGQRGVGAFDHAGVTEVGQLRGTTGDIADERRQRAGQLVFAALAKKVMKSWGSRPVLIAASRLAAEMVQTRSAVCWA